MDELWSAPAKVNLSLRVGRPRSDGFHPLESIVQAVDWSDELRFTDSDEDQLTVDGADLPTDGENLVWKAVQACDVDGRHPIAIELTKRIPSGAGLGGGSSDAACVIAALVDRYKLAAEERARAALQVGADVTFFLTGGTARMEGIGERITRLDPLDGFVIGLVVPEYRLATPEVYRTWDELGFPTGEVLSSGPLPPQLRHVEVVNDLTAAAVAVEPALGDLMADLSDAWERPVLMSGSGSAVFGCFADVDEASDALSAVRHLGATRTCALIARGVHRLAR